MTDISHRDRLRFRLSRVYRRAGARLPELGTGGLVTVGEIILILKGEVIEGLVEGVPLWLLAGVALSLPIAAGWLARVFHRRRTPSPRPFPGRLPAPAALGDLIGRETEVKQVVDRARESGLAVVQGPIGMGTSSVAIRATWELADDANKQRYADVRGPDRDHPEAPLSVAQRVMRTLDRPPGAIQEPADATSHVIDALTGTRRVLLLDNVSTWSQVAWLPPRVPGAYIMVAGTVSGELPRHVKPVQLGPLSPDAGRELLARHISDERADRGREAVGLMVDACVGSPSEIVRIGRWLARNPRISLRALVDDLNRLPIDEKLGFVLNLSIKQLRPTAKQLLILLAGLPIAEVDHQAAAALLGLPSAKDAINELAELGLVENVRMTRVRVTSASRDAGARSTPSQAAAWRRLVGHFADQADAFAAQLPADDARNWFAIEDQVLLQVLARRNPVPKTGRALGRIADALEYWFRLEQRHEDRLRAAEALARAAKALRDENVQATAELRQCAILLTSGDPRKARHHLDQAAQLRVKVESWPAELHLEHAAILLAGGDEFTAVESALVHYGQALSGGDVAGHALRANNIAALLMRKGQQLDHGGWGPEARKLYRQARAVLFESLEKAQRAGDRGAEAHAEELLALADFYLGQLFDAGAHLRQAERLYTENADEIGRARCLVQRAGAMLEDPGHLPEEVAALLDDALDGLPPAGVSTALAHLHLARLRPENAAAHREAGLAALAPWDEIAERLQVLKLREYLRVL
ncbi:hypothetical protein [Nonomuraea basaltis]|uniref:hypothetical protein n=1 Tax=Nonomuraea basaltis TaxID=2495887 RepID=UPI00110C6297|nr:hypothetical protein [Nonomuraea basaltis]TMR96376.1 hypothetical protein EJK15_23580 [Nonomuraea basaltis]